MPSDQDLQEALDHEYFVAKAPSQAEALAGRFNVKAAAKPSSNNIRPADAAARAEERAQELYPDRQIHVERLYNGNEKLREQDVRSNVASRTGKDYAQEYKKLDTLSINDLSILERGLDTGSLNVAQVKELAQHMRDGIEPVKHNAQDPLASLKQVTSGRDVQWSLHDDIPSLGKHARGHFNDEHSLSQVQAALNSGGLTVLEGKDAGKNTLFIPQDEMEKLDARGLGLAKTHLDITMPDDSIKRPPPPKFEIDDESKPIMQSVAGPGPG